MDSLFIRTMSALVKRHIVCIQALNRIKSNKLKRAIIANADADLLCALAECAYNILKKNIPLSELKRRRLSKYKRKLRELSQRRTPAARRRRILLQQQVGEGQSGGFLLAFLAPLASSVFLPLLREGVAEGAVGAPATTSRIEADVVDTVPKTMQGKARRLMEHLKRDIAWTARGELIHEGVPVAGSNVVDLVNDLLPKRKTDPTGWQPFARQLRAMNLPMELVGNVARRDYIRQATTPTMTSTPGRRRRMPTTPRSGGSARRSLSWTPLARRRSQMEHSMLTPPPQRQRKALASLASWEDI